MLRRTDDHRIVPLKHGEVGVTDARRDGRPVIGYGFSSIGRYGHGGLLRERFIPRLLASEPETLLDETGNLDPFRAWDALMRNEKPGGHGERSGAVGVLDTALWDIAAKILDVPLWRLLADRFNDGVADARVAVYRMLLAIGRLVPASLTLAGQ